VLRHGGGLCEAAHRFGRVPLEQLVAPAAALARDGVELTAQQSYIVELLAGIVTSTPECSALFAPHGDLLHTGERLVQPELAGTLERLGSEGAQPFYEGDIGVAITDWVTERGGLLTRADLLAYEVVDREPIESATAGARSSRIRRRQRAGFSWPARWPCWTPSPALRRSLRSWM